MSSAVVQQTHLREMGLSQQQIESISAECWRLVKRDGVTLRVKGTKTGEYLVNVPALTTSRLEDELFIAGADFLDAIDDVGVSSST